MSGANARLAASLGLDTRDYRRNMDGALAHTRTAQDRFGALARSVAGVFSLQAIAQATRAIGSWVREIKAANEAGKADFIDPAQLDRLLEFGNRFETATLRAKANVVGMVEKLASGVEEAAAFAGALAGGGSIADAADASNQYSDAGRFYAKADAERLTRDIDRMLNDVFGAIDEANAKELAEKPAREMMERLTRHFADAQYRIQTDIENRQRETLAQAWRDSRKSVTDMAQKQADQDVRDQESERERGRRMAEEIDAANRAKEEDRANRQQSLAGLIGDQQSLLSARDSVRVDDRLGGAVDSVQRSGGLLAASPTVAIRAEAEKVAAAKLTEINAQLATIAGWIKTATEELAGNE